jgi:hypothetical protein
VVDKRVALDMVYKACESGDWSGLGWSPKSSCKCMGRGHRGQNKSLSADGKKWEVGMGWNLCGCVDKAWPFILTYVTDNIEIKK